MHSSFSSVLMNEHLNLMTWNATGMMSSSSYIVDILTYKKVDILGISEHWLREIDLHFLDQLHSSYKSFSVCDSDLCFSNAKSVRKGGVAILYNIKHSNRICSLDLNDDRIIGIQFQCSDELFMYIFQVYLPSANHSVCKYKEYIEKLSDIAQIYSDKGVVLFMGDINAHISSNRFSKLIDNRGKMLLSFMSDFNLISANVLDICSGARSSFMSYNGQYESLIDHMIMPCEIQDMIVKCEILDDDSLNVSTHRPILCELNIPQYCVNINDNIFEPRLKWSKATVNSLKDYEVSLQHDYYLNNLLEADIDTKEGVDNLYNTIVQALLNVSDKTIPKSKYNKFLKPYWNSELTNMHNEMKAYRTSWINNGRPRNSSTSSFKLYKDAKALFRKTHRRACDQFLISLNSEIDKASEVDSSTFWKIVKMRSNKRTNARHVNGVSILKSYIPLLITQITIQSSMMF